ncbi:hypothetical protein FQN54_003220 [Arachnomyces sp. PD_36]|nr:hypothetical protein FQN54_003220 [Arachnomyces sp. PD_36]
MPSFFQPALQLALLLPLSLVSSAAPTCSDVVIPVTAKAEVHDISLPGNVLEDPTDVQNLLNSLLGIVDTLYPAIPVEGTYDISARYCEPENKVPEHSDTIQLLVHGATYTNTYWSGLGLPEDEAQQYSWVDYASKQGYATLSIDRLGAGYSSRPDPLLEVQTNMEAEVMHEIILQLRGETENTISNRSFSKIVYVGHSLGAFIGRILTQTHPSDVDGLILTGQSNTLLQNAPVLLGLMLSPAPIMAPDQFGGLSPLYLTRGSESGHRKAFYGLEGTFDPAFAAHDFETKNTVTVGEMATLFRGFLSSDDYAGFVHVINGEIDTLLCEGPGGVCSDGVEGSTAKVEESYPNVKGFSYDVIAETGHCLNLHYTAEKTFKAAHEFLNETGF